MRNFKFRRVSNWLASNPVFIITAAIASILSYFSDLKLVAQSIFTLIGIQNPIISSSFLFIAVWVVFITIAYIIDFLLGFLHRGKPPNHHGSMQSTLWQDDDGSRNIEFRELRSDANKSILVMGIGMTLFSKDLAYLEQLLKRYIDVRLLMINPNFVVDYLSKDKFEIYFGRLGYLKEVSASHDRLYAFIKDRKSQKQRIGSVELRLINDLIPMNVTIIDEVNPKLNGRMLIEWCFPYTDWHWRLALRLSRSQNNSLFENVKACVEQIWISSDRDIDDKP